MCSRTRPNLVFDAVNEVPKHEYFCSGSLVASAFKCVLFKKNIKSYFLVFFIVLMY